MHSVTFYVTYETQMKKMFLNKGVIVVKLATEDTQCNKMYGTAGPEVLRD